MSDNSETLEPWNDESNLSMDERRGTFLKVLCILSWVWIGWQLITNLISYTGGPERMLEAKSEAEDALAAVEDGGFMRTVMEEALLVIDKTIENFSAIHIGNIIGYLIGGLAVYLMWSLKKTGFFLYLVYVSIIIGVSAHYLGLGSASGEILFSLAFMIMYGVNLKRMNA